MYWYTLGQRLDYCLSKLASLFKLNNYFLRESGMSFRLPLMEIVSLCEKIVIAVGVTGRRIRVNFEVNKLISRHFINTINQFSPKA
jgi:hypothetical protein